MNVGDEMSMTSKFKVRIINNYGQLVFNTINYLHLELNASNEIGPRSDPQRLRTASQVHLELLEDDEFSDDSDDEADFQLQLSQDSDLNEETNLTQDNLSQESSVVDEDMRLMSYMPCAAHNIQLVLKDGLNINEVYINLINKVSKNIASKSKFSSIIAEELRNFGK